MHDSFESLLEKIGEVGNVEEVVQSLVQVTGLPGAKLWEVVTFENGQQGLVMALWEEKIEVQVFSRVPMRVGTRAARTGMSLTVAVGETILGKIVDGLGRGSDGSEAREVNVTPSGITTRKKISRQMETGVVMVDLLIPVGWGQRELVIGDRKTGKTHLILQALLSAAKAGKVCVYVAIGKEKRDIKRSHEFFIKEGVMSQIVLVAASSHDSLGEIYLAPYVGMTIAEYFRDLGRDVLLVLDDMTAHAVFYRELSLLARRFPGRDSYPGDIFHVHSKLLERAGNFAVGEGEAAITCLPVIDTVAGDITGYIQTNLMSMTDGHIYFDSEMYFTGRRPAINPFLSVTRVGRQTQSKLQRKLATEMIVVLANYEKTQAFVRFGAELGEAARQTLAAGERIQKFLSQGQFGVISIPVQTAGAALVLGGLWEEVEKSPTVKMQKAYETERSVKTVIDEIAAKAATVEEAVKLGGSLIHEQ